MKYNRFYVFVLIHLSCFIIFSYTSPQNRKLDLYENRIFVDESLKFVGEVSPDVSKTGAAADTADAILLQPDSNVIWRTEGNKKLRSGATRNGFHDSTEKPTLAILYFDNKTGDKNLEYLRYGLSEWIIIDLYQSKYINVLDGNRIHEVLGRFNLLDESKYSPEDLTQIANRFKISHIMCGSYFKDNETIVISAKLWDSHQEKIIRSFKKDGTDEDAFPPLVDDLTREIKAALDLTRDQIDGDFDKDVGIITTAVPEAFRYYTEGCMRQRKGQNQEAVSSYKKALEIDPEFALAYWKMGMAFPRQKLSSYSMKAGSLLKALELPDRLSTRTHYWIQGDYHSMTRYRYSKALEAYRRLLEFYPDDDKGHHDLGLVYFSIEEWEKAASQFLILVEAGHESPEIHWYLALSYINPGLYHKAQNVLESYLHSFGNNVNIYLTLALNYRYQGKYEQAHRVVEKAIRLYPAMASGYANKGDIYLYSGELDKAESQYRTLLKSENLQFKDLGLFRLAELYLLQGRFQDSRELAEKGYERAQKRGNKGTMRNRLSFAAQLDSITGHYQEALDKLDALWKTTLEDEELEWQRFIVYLKGLVQAESGDIDKALMEADKVRDLIAQGLDKRKRRLYLHLMGAIEIERKNFKKAIEYFEESLPLASIRSRLNIAVADSLAAAYCGIGDLERARKEYERMAAFPRGRQFYGDVYAKRYYRLGEIYEREGLKNKAIEHYQRFLDLWKNADPDLDEVEHSKKRLIELKDR